MDTLQQKQEKIIAQFKPLGQDRQLKLEYLIELGENLPPLGEKKCIEKNKISGCLSQVWLVYEYVQKKLSFRGDSNTVITKGLISILIHLYTEEHPQAILKDNLSWLNEIGLYDMVGPQRANGLQHMINRFKIIALQHIKKK